MAKPGRSLTDLASQKASATAKPVQSITRAFVEGDHTHGATIQTEVVDVDDAPSESDQSSRKQVIAKALPLEGLRSRLYPVVIITITMLASIAIFSLWFSGYHATGHVVDVVDRSRTSIQVLVQVASQILGMLWTTAFRTVILYFSRIQLAKRSLTLKSLRILNAVTSGPRTDKNLPLMGFVLSFLPFLLSLVPGVLWAGALTPEITSLNQNFSLVVPSWGNDSYHLAKAVIKREPKHMFRYQRPNGTFTNFPVYYNSAAFLGGISSAVSPDGTPQNHTRLLDKVAYQFHGRSYGVGASPGLVDVDVTNHNSILNYTYNEIGYTSQAYCYYNKSSSFRIHKFPNVTGNKGFPNEYLVTGRFPDYPARKGDLRWVLISSRDSNARELVALGTSVVRSSPERNIRYAAISAGLSHTVFDKIQCELSFKPTEFVVQVTNTPGLVQVAPRDPSPENVTELNPGGYLQELVVLNMGYMSQVLVTLHESSMGDVFSDNLYALQAYRNETISKRRKDVNNQTVLNAVEYSLTTYMDDILTSLGEAALYRNEIAEVQAIGRKSAVRIGSQTYIIATFVLNVTTWVAVILVMIFSRFFWGIPKFDFTDIGCVAVGATIGSLKHDNDTSPDPEKQGILAEDYDGTPKNKRTDELLVSLEHFPGTNQVGLVLR